MNVTLIGIDLAKSIFQVCGVNQAGKCEFNRPVKRAKLIQSLAQYSNAIIAMEACSGSNYWGRELKALGFQVLLIPPQHVKPFVKGNKNDRNDAFAITEAARRPHLKAVEPRTIEQTDIMQVHRVRERLIRQRTALSHQLRGFLAEYGIVLPVGASALFKGLPGILEDAENGLSTQARDLFNRVWQEYLEIVQRIKPLDAQIKSFAQTQQAARLMQVKGVAAQTATAVMAHMGAASHYKNGRHYAASLGLVPKEHSSGGKQRISGTTKRGNQYVRALLIQGAWSIIRYAERSTDRLSRWAVKLIERRGKQKTAMAVANKLARILWSMSFHESDYIAG